MIQTLMPNKVTSAIEVLEDFPGMVDAVEAFYKDTISGAEEDILGCAVPYRSAPSRTSN